MEPADNHRRPHLLDLPGDNEVFAGDGNVSEVWIKPKSSPRPRRRSSSSDEGPEPPLSLTRKVSFADAFGLDLVSVREFDKWEARGCSLDKGEPAALQECLLLPLYQLPSSPAELKQRLYAQKVELESAEFPPGSNCMKGLIRVLNMSYEKLVSIRMTLNNWESHYDILADYVADSCEGQTDQFTFKILLVPPYLRNGTKIEFAIRYETRDAIYWANNCHKNYVVLCHKEDDLNASEKLHEHDERNLKSCLKTSYSKRVLETCDGHMNLPSSEAQQESREIILETTTIPRWNTESLLNQNIEQKEKTSKQRLDTQMHPPLHISLTNPRGQETNLSQLEGLYFYVKEENEKNVAAISESPNNQQEYLEVKHTMFPSTENKIKQEEVECLGIPSASNRNTPNLKIQSHERDINAKEITDSGNVATSNINIITQSSELFAINGSHLQHEDSLPFALKRDEAVTSHATDTSTNSLKINRPLGKNLHKIPANDMQNNLVIIPDVMGVCGKLTSNRSHPTNLVKNSADCEDKSGEDVNLIGDASSIGESESLHDSAICTNTDDVCEREGISSLFHGSVSSQEMQIFNARISDVQVSSQYSTEADNLEAIKLEDLSKRPHSQKKGAESTHVQNPTNRTDKVIPFLTQVPENDSTETNVADELNKDKVGALLIAEQCISMSSCMLADTMVKEATEAALLAITGDEGVIFAAASPRAKALTNDEQYSNQEVTTVLNLPSMHGELSNICVTNEQTTKSVSELGEHATETSLRHVQVGKITSQAAQKNMKEETSSRVSLHTRASPLPLEDALHNGKQSLELIQNLTAAFQMTEEDSRGGTTARNIGKGAANYVQMVSDQEEAQKRLSHEITETTENIFEFQNYEVKKMHTLCGKQMAVYATELTREEKDNDNGKCVKVIQNCSVSESDYSHHYSVSDVKESLEGGRVNLEEEHTLYAKTDESMKCTQIYNVTVVSQVATETVLSCELTAGEVGAECDNIQKYKSGVDNETVMESEEATNMFAESLGDNYYFEKVEMFHDTQHIPTNRSTSQKATKPKVNISLGSTMCTINCTKGKKNRVFPPQQNSELNNHHKCLDPIMLINMPVKKDDGKESDTDVVGDIHPNSGQLKSRECSEGTQKDEQVGEAFDSSQLDSELFTNEDTLKSTLWKVCYFVLFVVFLVTVYHYDFIGCFILYLFSLYWLYCEGEESSVSVRKD